MSQARLDYVAPATLTGPQSIGGRDLLTAGSSLVLTD